MNAARHLRTVAGEIRPPIADLFRMHTQAAVLAQDTGGQR